MTKKELYESIMRSVSYQVKKVLNEEYIKDSILSKYKIINTETDDCIGYCLCDLDNIDIDFGTLIGTKFKKTFYDRKCDEHGNFSKIIKNVTYPEYQIIPYEEPINDIITQTAWKGITIDKLKKYPYYNEYEYNGHTVYIGLFIYEKDLEKLIDNKIYNTNYYGGGMGQPNPVSSDSFDTATADYGEDFLKQFSTEELIAELEKRNIHYKK